MSVENKINRLIEEGIVNWAKNNPGLATAGAAGLGLVGSGLAHTYGELGNWADTETDHQEATKERLLSNKAMAEEHPNLRDNYTDDEMAQRYNKAIASTDNNLARLKNFPNSADHVSQTIQKTPNHLYRALHPTRSFGGPEAWLDKGLAAAGAGGLAHAGYKKYKNSNENR